MKSTIKNRYVIILFIVITVLFCILCCGCNGCKSCSSDKDNGSENDGEKQKITVTLDKSQTSIILGDEAYLKATVTGANDVTVVWSSNDSAIAAVDENGKITANSIGNAIIKATCAEQTAECAVTVSTDGMVPTLEFESIPDENVITVSLSDKINLTPVVKFNGKTFTDGKFEVKVKNNSVGEYENGVFSPLSVGETEVEIVGKWRGLEGPCLNKTFIVKTINNLSVVVNGGLTSELFLYTVANHGGKDYDTASPFEVIAQENGKDIEYTVAVSSGGDIVSYDENAHSVTALKYGSATITVTFKDGSGEYGTLDIPVTVKRPVAEYSETIEFFSALDGELPIGQIFGEETDITDAYCDGSALIVDSGKIFGIETERASVTLKRIEVYNERVGYVLNVEAYTKVLKDESDLSVFNVDRNGYFVMSDDIVCSGTSIISNGGIFKGVFDGNGHMIKNAKFSVNTGINPISGGIFGVIGDNAVIRNLGVVGADISPWNSAILAGSSRSQYNAGALIENIYIEVAKSGARPAPLMWSRGPWDQINNVLINAAAMPTSGYNNAYGLMFATNSYNVGSDSNTWNKDNANLTNVYVVAKDGIPLMDNLSYNSAASNENKRAKIYASNDGVQADSAQYVYVYGGVKRYNDTFSLSNAVNKIGDDENYWSVTVAGVEWKGKLPTFETIEYDKVVEFSALDGDLPIADIFGSADAIITEAYQGGTSLHIVNNKVFGVATKNDGVTETEIIVCSALGKYSVRLNAYTKIIDEESDFSVFDVSGGTVKGYYVLGCDVVCSGEKVWANASADRDTKMFDGVLDGRGYKVIGIKAGKSGIFGMLGKNAVIKNIAFVQSLLNDSEWEVTPFIANASMAANAESKIENVYLDFADFRSSKGGNRGAGLFEHYNANISIKDVVVNIRTKNFRADPQYGYGALFINNTTVNKTATNLVNVYVISELMPMAMLTSGNADWAAYAGNDKETVGKIDKTTYYYFEGVSRFDDLASLAAKTQKVGNWKITSASVEWEN